MPKNTAGSLRKKSRLRAHDTTIDLTGEDVFDLPSSEHTSSLHQRCSASETPSTSSVPEIIDLSSEDQHDILQPQEQPDQRPVVLEKTPYDFKISDLLEIDDLPPPPKIPALECSLPCPICFCNMFEAPKVLSTKCGHLFCQECLMNSLQNKALCPMCRKRVTKSQVHVVYLNGS